MSKKDKQLFPFLDWINIINENQDKDPIVMYGDEFFNKMKNKAFKDLVYRNIFNRLINIILKMFKWKMPDTMVPRALELGLLWRGWACVYKEHKGIFCLPCVPSNFLNIYGEPTQVRVYGFNGYQTPVDVIQDFETPAPDVMAMSKEHTSNQGVVMRDNDRAYPYINYIRQYAYQIADKIIALNVATQRLKSPFVYTLDEKELKDTVTDIIERIENNEDLIIKLKSNKTGVERDPVKLEQNNMRPDIVKAIKESILFDFDQFLETIGINTNPTPDKSQYVNDEEIGSNNSLIDLEQDVRFLNRKKFCENAKKLGVEMSVEKNLEEAQRLAMKFKNEVKGEKDDTNKQPTSDR